MKNFFNSFDSIEIDSPKKNLKKIELIGIILKMSKLSSYCKKNDK